MEELNKQVIQHILLQSSFESLPHQVKQLVGNPKNYNQLIIKYSFQHQLKWRGNMVSKIFLDEKQYYFDLMQNSKSNFMVLLFYSPKMWTIYC